MKKRTILLLAFLLTYALCFTTANAAQEWVLQRTLNFGGVVRSIAFHPTITQLAIGTDYNNTDYNLEIYHTKTFANLHERDFKDGNDDEVYAVAFRKGWYEVAVSYWDNLSFYNSR